jgi:hypothetical protein
MEQLQIVLEWAKANPWVTTAIVVYVIANLAPRPDPSKMTGWQRAFWQIVDRLCVLTHDKLPGGLKMLLLDSPPIKPAKLKKAKKVSKPAPESEDDPEPESEDEPEVDAEEPEDDNDDSDGEAEPSPEDEKKGAPT